MRQQARATTTTTNASRPDTASHGGVGSATTVKRPEIPSIAELIPGFDLSVTQSVYARTGTPPEIVKRMAAEIAHVVKIPDVVQKFTVAGIDPVGAGPEELAAILAREGVAIDKILQAAGLKVN